MAGIVDKTFDLRTLSYLLMGTTTLFQIQVNDFEKFVQSILIKFKFVENTNELNTDKTLMDGATANEPSKITKTMHVATPVQFTEGVEFDNLDIVHLHSEFVSAKQLKANCTAERHLQMPSTIDGLKKSIFAQDNSSAIQENKGSKVSYESESDFDNMPFNISIIQPPDSQSENDQGYISIAGSEYWKDDDRHEICQEQTFPGGSNEDDDLMPPPPLKRQKMGVAKIDQSIQMPLSRIRHLISDRSSLIRPDRLGRVVPFPVRQSGISSLRFMLDIPSVRTSNPQILETFKLPNEPNFIKYLLLSSNDCIDSPEIGRGNNDLGALGDDEMMDIDHDEAFLTEDNADNGAQDVTELDGNEHIMLADNNGGFDTSIDQAQYMIGSKVRNAFPVENVTTLNYSKKSRPMISPVKLLEGLNRYTETNAIKDNVHKSTLEDHYIDFKTFISIETKESTNPRRFAAKCFHDLLKLKMTQRLDLSQSKPYGSIKVVLRSKRQERRQL